MVFSKDRSWQRGEFCVAIPWSLAATTRFLKKANGRIQIKIHLRSKRLLLLSLHTGANRSVLFGDSDDLPLGNGISDIVALK